ncbi:hypothetical protein B0J12DRAFT_562714 [Macrophomina phaseolina]|uniref:NAD dependent epimerase/dehydratase n=1 Tax=Macrophomina phaseolina TaxID=35725 RepID=A0ABQ8GS13_9PEZI|nr:hypothetical protein B0J12DRAFT_562714 [Macrophomina phaseolina]
MTFKKSSIPFVSQHSCLYGSPPITLKVINCGLPRTGTTSAGTALSIFLGGPVADGGRLAYMGSAGQQRLMLELVQNCLCRTLVDRTFALYCLARLTEGCIAVTDKPFCYFVEELLQLYPHAKVICTRRDQESWWEGYKNLRWRVDDYASVGWVSPTLYRFLAISYGFFWKRVPQAVGLPEDEIRLAIDNQKVLYGAHDKYIRRIVPEGQLHFVNIRDGWKPRCDILQLPVPGVEFPHDSSRGEMSTLHRKTKRRLIIRGALLISLGLGCCGWLLDYFRRALGSRARKLLDY